MALLLKIQIRGIKNPPVWRRLIIPDKFTFAKLHQTIQTAFGWWNEHLYVFQKSPHDGDWCISSSELEDDYMDNDALEAAEVNIKEFISQHGLEKFVYVYDFGDNWIHEITVEDTKYLSSNPYPVCLNGKGAGPSEDCGGIWGYEELKEEMSKEIYSYFDKEEINDDLKGEFSSYSDVFEDDEDEDDEDDDFIDNEEDIPETLSILEIIEEFDINVLFTYAEFMSLDLDKKKRYNNICKQYVEQILDKPKSILRMLPFEDFCILRKLYKNPHPKNLVGIDKNNISYVLQKYGLADEWITDEGRKLQIASDFFKAVEPYIDVLHNDIEYKTKVKIESFVTGLANIYGLVSRSFVLQEMVRHEISSSIEDAEEQLDLITSQSLQMHELYCESDKYEKRQNNDNCYYHSRFDEYWPIKLAEEREAYSHKVSGYARFDLNEILHASTPLPTIPNVSQENFCNFLVNELKVEHEIIPQILHELWFMLMNDENEEELSLGIQLYFEKHVFSKYKCTDKQRAKAINELIGYLNNMPFWLLLGHTPQETGVLLSKYSKSSSKPLSFLERTGFLDMIMPTKPYVLEKTPRPNDPCPCGSGKKYKKCCGKS